ncbi:hypothetical protein AQJ91_00340 [Streptomyces dysideae]|uniref:Uncharacterized protein n=1 Tax=Streptomyces dysideae TaxID=909626 RepID=A0A117S2U9_9ACTN|nr:hypothetical protein AQJ91_00340 [Streptomyces dysideae]
MASSMCPAGNSFFDTSHLSSVAVTLIVPSPPAVPPPFSVQPVTAVRAATAAVAVRAESLAARMRAPRMAEKYA